MGKTNEKKERVQSACSSKLFKISTWGTAPKTDNGNNQFPVIG